MIKVLLPICTLIWRVNNYVSRQRKLKIGEIKVQLLLYKIETFCIVPFSFLNHLTVLFIKTFSLMLRGDRY